MNYPQMVDGNVEPIEGDRDSLFIACASYEERTLLAVRRLSPGYHVDRCIICRSIEYADKGRAPFYFDEMQKRLNACGGRQPDQLPFSLEDPVGFIRLVEEKIASVQIGGPAVRITVDITTFPRQELLILLRYLDCQPHRGRIRLLYGEPETYATEDEDQEACWLTRGVRSVSAVPGFCGVQYPQLFKLLVVVLGHEGERTHITLRRHQPDKVIFLGQGREQYHNGLEKIVERENRNMIAQYGEGCFWRTTLPARGIAETQEVIEEIFMHYRYTHNMFVAPNGTKLQLLGTYLAARKLIEIQITYATPVIYNWATYSTGGGQLWELVLEPMEHLSARHYK